MIALLRGCSVILTDSIFSVTASAYVGVFGGRITQAMRRISSSYSITTIVCRNYIDQTDHFQLNFRVERHIKLPDTLWSCRLGFMLDAVEKYLIYSRLPRSAQLFYPVICCKLHSLVRSTTSNQLAGCNCYMHWTFLLVIHLTNKF